MGLTYFIAGATRGIGLEMAKQASEESSDNIVIASSRSAANAGKLQELADTRKNIHIVELEVGNSESTAKLAEQLKRISSGIDIFINNAGICTAATYNPTTKISSSVWLDHYKTNVLGAIEVFQVVYPFLAEKSTKKIVFVSSAVASFSEFIPMEFGAYGQSKVALNYTVRHIAGELEAEKFIVIPVHPGMVSTGMGNQGIIKIAEISPAISADLKSGIITPQESAGGILKLAARLEQKDSGKFFYWNGTEHDY